MSQEDYQVTASKFCSEVTLQLSC